MRLIFLDDFVLSVVCDLNLDELTARFGNRPDILQPTDYRDILNAHEVDVVVLCTPNHLHIPIALDVLKANKHVLCKKPMAVVCLSVIQSCWTVKIAQ